MTEHATFTRMEESTRTDWQKIGGEYLRDQFAGHAHYSRTAEFCELHDNPAFDPKGETLPMSEFEPMVRRVFAQPVNSIYKASPAVAANA